MSEIREFLLLAPTTQFNPKKDSIGGWLMSEKIDGMRAFWDGGVTRGIPCSEIPFANIEKHERFIVAPISTGLWSRYGQPIHAPDWWLNGLPKIMLDGELYAGRGNFQFVTSTVKDHVAGEGWKRINYHVFELPPIGAIFGDGRMTNKNFKKTFKGIEPWFHEKAKDIKKVLYGTMFETVYTMLLNLALPKETPIVIHNQIQLPLSQDKAVVEIERWLEVVSSNGGEGLMLRKRESVWIPKRTSNLLKVKKLQDSEGVVIGYTTGEETDKGSKLLGMLGSLKVSWQGKIFDLSGFTDEERDFGMEEVKVWAKANPGCELPEHSQSLKFPRGCKVTFKYREVTDDGYPKEARYFRKKVD